jgi:Methyltransferase domain
VFNTALAFFSRVGRFDAWDLSVLGLKSRRQAPPEVVARGNRKADLDAVFASIGLNGSYETMDFSGLTEDIQGWESQHRIFGRVFERYRPSLVIEVGTWKGASVLHMDRLSRRLECGTSFICVDTWLGSNDSLWLDAEFRKSLMLQNGYPTMFRQFVFNVKTHEALDRIYPLPMTSTCGAYLLKRLQVQADAIYIDAGHEEDEVYVDLDRYFSILRPGGAMFGDDYSDDWIGVKRAVDRFCAEHGLALQIDDGKWLFEKPDGAATAGAAVQ